MPRNQAKAASPTPSTAPTTPDPSGLPAGFELLNRRAYKHGNAVHYQAIFTAQRPLRPARLLVSVRRDFYPDQSYAHVHGFNFTSMEWSNPLALLVGSRMKSLAIPVNTDPGNTIPAPFLEDEAELLRLAALVLKR